MFGERVKDGQYVVGDTLGRKEEAVVCLMMILVQGGVG